METNAKPATNLPWGSLYDCTAFGIGAEKRDQNVRYAIHAANAYPQLVEALRELIACDTGAADGTHSGPFGGALDPARALLRSLGEA